MPSVTPKEAPKTAERVTVVLAGKHVHKGREFGRGDKLELRADQAEFLIAKNRAAREGQPLPDAPGAIKTIATMGEVDAAIAADVMARKAK